MRAAREARDGRRAPADAGAPVSVFESGPSWQVATLGPMAGQNHHVSVYAPEKLPYTIDRSVRETNPVVRCGRAAAGQAPLPCWRLVHHCRHRGVPVDRALGVTGGRSMTRRTSSAGSRRSPSGPRPNAPQRMRARPHVGRSAQRAVRVDGSFRARVERKEVAACQSASADSTRRRYRCSRGVRGASSCMRCSSR
jgi:hypothetical protein